VKHQEILSRTPNPPNPCASSHQLSRRAFLQSAGAGAITSLTAAPTLMSSAAEAADSAVAARIKIGFLGASHSHALSKAKVLQASPAYELIGVYELDAKVRASFEALGIAALSQNELTTAADVIAVESGNEDHARHAKIVLQAGKHLHLEKPPTEVLSSFRELLKLAREHDRLMQMGYMWRYHPGINACLEAAREGWLGEVYQVRAAIDTTANAESRRQWGRFRGGIFFELGCHLVDPLIRLLGRPRKIHGTFQRLGGDPLADNTVVTFEFPRALGLVTSAARQPMASAHRAFEILGTNGRAVVQPLEPPSLALDLQKAAGPYAAGPQNIPLPRYERYAPEFADLAEAIHAKRSLRITPEEDLLVHESFLRACDLD
jgi:predicted dehydrogenase